ncbi:MAG: hypothetical protein RIF33_10905 [Cyclobacteriaceae bacterium]
MKIHPLPSMIIIARSTFAFFLFVSILIVGCKPTELVGSWKDPAVPTQDFKKIGVVMLSPNMEARAVLETEMAGALRSSGAPGLATFDIFPLAGRTALAQELEVTEEQRQAHIKKRVEEFDFDAILVMAILDVQKEEHYHSGSSFSVGLPAYPVYGYGYTGYYGYIYNTVYAPGYYETASTYFLESNLYDAATEQLIWTGQTRTKDPKSIDKEAAEVAKLIVHELKTKEALNIKK